MLFWASLISFLCFGLTLVAAMKLGGRSAIRIPVLAGGAVLGGVVASLLTGVASLLGAGLIGALFLMPGGALAGFAGAWVGHRLAAK